MPVYPITIKGLYISPEHRYYDHQEPDWGEERLLTVQSVEIVEGAGIRGDRFFGKGEVFVGHVTFFAWEVFQTLLMDGIGKENQAPVHAGHFRRNIVVEGVDLRALIGHPFQIGGIPFEGTKHCAPCKYMEHSFGTGALAALRGRGGLRARALGSGSLQLGENILNTEVSFNSEDAAEPLPATPLP